MDPEGCCRHWGGPPGNLGGRGRRPDFLAKCELTTIPQQPPILIGGSGALSKRTFPCTSSNKIQKDARQAFVSGAGLPSFGPPGVRPPFFPHALRLQLPEGRGTATAAHSQACRWCPREAVAGGPIRPEATSVKETAGQKAEDAARRAEEHSKASSNIEVRDSRGSLQGADGGAALRGRAGHLQPCSLRRQAVQLGWTTNPNPK